MYILFGDETNIDLKNPDFVLYGAIFFKIDSLCAINHEIDDLRKQYGLNPHDELKSTTKSHELKQKVIEIGIKYKVKFLIHIIHYTIAKGLITDPKKSELHNIVCSALDWILYYYDMYLKNSESKGICVVDHRSESFKSYFAQKLSDGLFMVYDEEPTPLNNIDLYCISHSGASHVNSLADIVLGEFKKIINTRNKPITQSIQNIFNNVFPMTQFRVSLRPYRVGIIIRPPIKKIEVKKYKDEYEKIIKRFNELLQGMPAPF
jgi:hypothetical protein